MSAKEQYKYARKILLWHRERYDSKVLDHNYVLWLLRNIRLDILMKAWQTL